MNRHIDDHLDFAEYPEEHSAVLSVTRTRVWPAALAGVLVIVLAAMAVILTIRYYSPEQSAARYCHRVSGEAGYTLCMQGRGFSG